MMATQATLDWTYTLSQTVWEHATLIVVKERQKHFEYLVPDFIARDGKAIIFRKENNMEGRKSYCVHHTGACGPRIAKCGPL